MDKISEEKIKPLVRGEIGRELIVYDTIGSTNDAAKLLAKNGAPHGAAVIACRQTAGRGRLGRDFYSPEGTGIYMTVILRPALPPENAQLITPAAAVATARAIEETTGISVAIKWVNDLYFEGGKLCGILAESAMNTGGTLDYVVLGIGINITTDSFPPALAGIATSLAAANGGAPIDGNRLIAAVLNRLDDVCGQLESRAFLAEYKARSCVLGKRIVLLQGETAREAVAVDIDENARLVAKLASGETVMAGAGEISLKGDWR